MSFEYLFLPTVARLSELISRQYGCQLDYHSVEELELENPKSLGDGLRRGEPVSAGDWVFFPIFSGDSLAGAARISNRDKIDDKELKYISQFVRMVLESRLNELERAALLEEFERRLKLDGTSRANNVISMQYYRENTHPLPVRKAGAPLNFPFLIECASGEDLFKMAIEIHSRTNRYAMLPLEDLDPSVFETPESIQQLGHVTIFVKDVTLLTKQIQSQLVRYYNSTRDKESPQIVAGTPVSIQRLKRDEHISTELLSLLMVGYLCMTQPFASYKKQNLLEFFYDSLTGRTSV